MLYHINYKYNHKSVTSSLIAHECLTPSSIYRATVRNESNIEARKYI